MTPKLARQKARLRASLKARRMDGDNQQHWGYYGVLGHGEPVPEVDAYQDESGRVVHVSKAAYARGSYESDYEGWGI
jgi:hypothetical protein